MEVGVVSFDNNHDDKKKPKRSLYNILDKEGFYIILFLCVCIVAVTAVWVSNQNRNSLIGDRGPNKILEDDQPEVTLVEGEAKGPEDSSSETTAKPVKENNAGNTTQGNLSNIEKNNIDEVPKEEKKPVETEEVPNTTTTAKSSASVNMMLMPVAGKLGLPFAQDHLVYHETLEQWSTHKGIDIHADEGAPVRAVLQGEVIEVLNDTIMGITISILHEDETITRYSNLSTDAMVKVGANVNKGQIISGVGKTASVKTVEGPLLHFQVIKDGKIVDPQSYLPKFNN